MNFIENLWNVLNRSAYKEQRHFSTFDELKAYIHECWNNIQTSTLGSLYCPMQKKCLCVVNSDGRKTHL